MNKSALGLRKSFTSALLVVLLILTWNLVEPQRAAAAELNVYGVTVSWKDKLYQADGCSYYEFEWYNGVGKEILSVELNIEDPYGRQLGRASKIGVPNNTRGVFKVMICKDAFKAGLGPYSVKLYIEDYSSGFGSRQGTKDLYFLEIPGSSSSSSSSPTPAPTVTVTAKPSPVPTVTVTATPAPAPTVTVTASAAPVIDPYFKNEATRLQLELTEMRNELSTLKAKLAKICKSKPKPKGC